MALGPGKYDEQCTQVREETKAIGVCLLVFDGLKGSGFSVQTEDFRLLAMLPQILRDTANQIESSGGAG
jgi:hypothetical protein